ncbi:MULTISPECIES: FMN-dependent NADH-azoreductase [Actinoplanes]|uniref:FMN dependent NADH:quinone oxidoreductase n=2 Tax=Actinoplanes TaxID=1865 RepID=A0A0X3UYI8_9ACTN|nr:MULTISPECIES: NAD(P)H-dependent oxidoreductase [Actinoplanes]KUL37581.1 ACP phosphodiesterase [Actinoplanes awajinensis subsp. mycoplanecinus]GIE68322.1 FMN-dependent NADH-azoreductase [Actinoplanes palleronii]
MSILRIDASILGPNSASSALADIAEAAWLETAPDAKFVRRHIGNEPVPATAWQLAVSSGYVAEADRPDAMNEAVALAQSLAAELRDADGAILALPFYNFGVSQHVKAWFDLAIAGGEQGEKLLDGKPVIVITTRGGAYGPGTPREGWDHNTDFLKRIVGDIWGADLVVIEREFTLVGVNPALDAFTETATAMKEAAHTAAAEAGRTLAAR